MSFDREVLNPIPTGWGVPAGRVPVTNGETVLGHAELQVVDDGILAHITLDGETDEWPDDLRVGVVGQVTRFHYSDSQPDVQVVDEVRVKAVTVG